MGSGRRIERVSVRHGKTSSQKMYKRITIHLYTNTALYIGSMVFYALCE